MKDSITIKTALLVLLFGLALGLTVSAQGKRDTIRAKQNLVQRKNLSSELALNKEQSKQLKEVNQDIRTKLTALRNDTTLMEDTRKKEQRRLVRERQQRISGLLTADQQKKYRQLQKSQLRNRKPSKNMNSDSLDLDN